MIFLRLDFIVKSVEDLEVLVTPVLRRLVQEKIPPMGKALVKPMSSTTGERAVMTLAKVVDNQEVGTALPEWLLNQRNVFHN
jgi:hypothetical protein